MTAPSQMPPQNGTPEAPPPAREEHTRELLATWYAELSVLIMIFPLLDLLMHDGARSKLQWALCGLSPFLSLAIRHGAIQIRVGQRPWWAVFSR